MTLWMRACALLLISLAVWGDPMQVAPQGTKTVSATTSSAATPLAAPIGLDGLVRQVEIQNAGPQAVFVEFGDSTITAAVATGYPILVGQAKVITVGGRVTHVAAITSTSTATVYVTVGTGE